MWPKNTHVIVRADLNIPLLNNKPAHFFKIISFLPTLNKLLEDNNAIRIITHLGNPNAFTLAPSTKILLPFFTNCGYPITFAQTIHEACNLTDQIIVLENLRFIPYEKTQNILFAKKIKQLGSFFVQDAFASLHNKHTSIVTLPTLFTHKEKAFGFLVEKELAQLQSMCLSNANETVYMLSGGKVKKIEHVYTLLNKKISVILGPLLCMPFLCLKYHKNHCCINNKKSIDFCTAIQKHELFETHVLLPIDLFIKRNTKEMFVTSDSIHTTDIVLSIGPKTVALFLKKIDQCNTIVINGYMGFVESDYCIEVMQYLFQKAFQKKHCLIGGGDTMYFIDSFTNPPASVMRSTGGGAMLAYLTNLTLPGLHVF